MAQPAIQWHPDEIRRAAAIAADIAAQDMPRRVSPGSALIHLSSETAVPLLDGIRKTRRVPPVNFVPIRRLYQLLGFDENHPFRWRLEHKLVQSLVLHHFCPDCVPVTCGVSTYLARHRVQPTEENLRRLKEVYLKTALGSGADPGSESDTKAAIAAILSGQASAPSGSLISEQWVVQERLSIAEEYRVHTIEDSVVPDLTYVRYSGRTIRAERDGPNEYVQSILETLPNAFVAESICGWDICRTTEGAYKIIEVNFGGFHPDVERGFQCSGFFAREVWGPYVTARLLLYIEKKYRVSVFCDGAAAGPAQLSHLYLWISRWLALLRICDLVELLESSMRDGRGSMHSEDVETEYMPARAVLSDAVRRLRKATAGLG